MPTIVRPERTPKPKRKTGRPKLEPGPVKAQPAGTADETERTLWNLRQQISGLLQRLDDRLTLVEKLKREESVLTEVRNLQWYQHLPGL